MTKPKTLDQLRAEKERAASGCRGFSAYNGLQSAESIRTSGKCSQRDQQTSPDADWTICSE